MAFFHVVAVVFSTAIEGRVRHASPLAVRTNSAALAVLPGLDHIPSVRLDCDCGSASAAITTFVRLDRVVAWLVPADITRLCLGW